MDYFIGAPKEVKQLADKETLQYLLDEINGDTVPVITTAFWEGDGWTYSIDSFEDFIENGGFLIEIQTKDIETAMNIWKEYYDISGSQIKLLHFIFERKISNPSGEIILMDSEIKMIQSEDEEGLNESRISFGELGIKWEL